MLLLLLSCSTPTETPSSGDSVVSRDSPGFELPEAEPVWTAEQAAERIEEALVPGLPVPSEAINVLAEVIETYGDGGCPGMGFVLPHAFEGCTARSGWSFGGLMEYAGMVPPIEQASPFQVLCDGFISSPAGERMVLAGELEVDEGLVTVEGTWAWPLAEQDWLREGYSGALAMSSGEGLRSLAGSLQIGERSPLFIDLEESQESCPLGQLRVRQEDGYWYTLQVQDCSGCGPMSFEGAELGPACVEGLDTWLDSQADLR